MFVFRICSLVILIYFVLAGNVIYLLGIDVISGTPVIDIKPYIPQYDSPCNIETSLIGKDTVCVSQEDEQLCAEDSASLVEVLPDDEVNKCGSFNDSRVITCYQTSARSENTVKPEVLVAQWITNSQQPSLSVIFTTRAEQQLQQFDNSSPDPSFQLRHLVNASELKSALTAVLQADPRSVYRRQHCQHQLYYVTVDIALVTCWFDDDIVEVLKVQSVLVANRNENM